LVPVSFLEECLLDKIPWWKTAVIYQIYPRSFADTSGNGIGDLRGIIDHLDYLNDDTSRSLGVDAIWLSPIFPSPQYDYGYDVSDYTGIDPVYGTMQDFEELLTEAHSRGIRILLDLVLNHTSHEHSWFEESRSSRDNPKRDWYVWHDGPISEALCGNGMLQLNNFTCITFSKSNPILTIRILMFEEPFWMWCAFGLTRGSMASA
jgi:hypothetical protein